MLFLNHATKRVLNDYKNEYTFRGRNSVKIVVCPSEEVLLYKERMCSWPIEDLRTLNR